MYILFQLRLPEYSVNLCKYSWFFNKKDKIKFLSNSFLFGDVVVMLPIIGDRACHPEKQKILLVKSGNGKYKKARILGNFLNRVPLLKSNF